MNEGVASVKMRQLVCQNSPELKELERHLQTAYNRHILESIIAQKRAQSLQERNMERQLEEMQNNVLVEEEMRLRNLKVEEKKKKNTVAEILRQQINERLQRANEDLENDRCHSKILEQRVQEEKAAEERANALLQSSKRRALEEQEKLVAMRRLWREEEKRQGVLDEQKLIDDASRKRAEESAILAEKEQRIARIEAMKDIIAENLAKNERLKREKEELAIRLLCAEQEEKERKKFQKEYASKLERHEAAKQTFDQVTKERIRREMEEKQLDTLYQTAMLRALDISKEQEKIKAERNRKERLAAREDNFRLMQWKQERMRLAKGEDLADLKASEAKEETRMRIVMEERLQLLKSIDRNFLQYLPRACLTEEDKIKLNFTGG